VTTMQSNNPSKSPNQPRESFVTVGFANGADLEEVLTRQHASAIKKVVKCFGPIRTWAVGSGTSCSKYSVLKYFRLFIL
jgi:hypothetical protein